MPERLGRYELLKRIAQGGMAEIFLARAGSITGIEKVVVVKRMLPQFVSEPEFIEMFLDEARVAAGLNHPNIVQMYDAGDDAGRYFMAMEYLHGEDMRGVVRALRAKNRKLPLEHAVHVAIGMCAGLHHAHDAVGMDGQPLNIVHRDISPHNVFVTFDGAVKVVDFGIAKSRNRKTETRAGTLKGKVPYMSPEQLRGDGAIDRRSDVYATGIMLYEITVGSRPHVTSGQGEFALMMAIARGDLRPPTAVLPEYPKELERIILKALARLPAQRYQTTREMQEDLEAFARDQKLSITPTALAAFMLDTFGARVEAWRNAQAEGRNLAEAAVKLEEARKDSVEDSESDVEAPIDLETLNLLGASTDYGVDVVRRELDGIQVVTLQGRLTEAFQGSALGRDLGQVTVLDLASVERITSFGVREWLAMIEAAKATSQGLYLARCSDAFVNQLSMIRSLAGHAQLVSFYAPYVCEQCGTSFKHLVDLERDAAPLEAGKAPPTECPTCGGRGRLDDDPSFLSFALPHLGKKVPDSVRAALTAMDREARASTEQVEKLVVGATTRIHVRRALDRSIRWTRVLDGIEGAAVLELTEVGKVSPDGADNLGQALRALGPEVTSFEIVGAPSSVVLAVGEAAQRVKFSSVVFEGPCSACDSNRSRLVSSDVLAAAHAAHTAPSLTCRRCNAPMKAETWPQVEAVLFREITARTSGEPVVAVTAPAAVTAANGAPPRPSWTLPAAGGALLVVVLAVMFFASRSAPTPPPSVAPAASTAAAASAVAAPSAPSNHAPPEWLGRAREDLAGATVLLGTATAANEEQALVAARASAIRGFALEVVGRMKDGQAKQFVIDRLGADFARAKLEDVAGVAERWLRQVGASATPVRVASHVETTPEGVRVSARYSLSHEALEATARHYEQLATLGGVGIAPLFPLLESTFRTKADLVVVTVSGKTTVRAGDLLLDVDGAAVRSIAAVETARNSASKGAKISLGFESGGARTTVEVTP